MKAVVSSTLARAMHEDLVMRNIMRLAELPARERQATTPWTAAEARAFLEAARGITLYPAFALLLFYGLRCAEVLGLRWRDVDEEDAELRIRQQLHCAHGKLSPVKCAHGRRRDLPLLGSAAEILETRRTAQAADRLEHRRAWQDNGLVLTTKTGQPIEPRRLALSLRLICDIRGLRPIKLHHLRHTTAMLLNDMKVPAGDIQLILGSCGTPGSTA